MLISNITIQTQKNQNQLKQTNNHRLPHASSILERVGPTLERPIEVAMNLVLLLTALIDKRELEERSDVGALAGERDEDRNVSGIVLRVLPVGVEVNRPLVTSDGENVARNVLPHSHALRQRVSLDHELVRAVHRLRHRSRARRREQWSLVRRHG